MTLTAAQTAFLARHDIRFVRDGATSYFVKGDTFLMVRGADISLMVRDESEDADGERFLAGFETLNAGIKALLAR